MRSATNSGTTVGDAGPVVAQRLVDLVADAQLGQPQRGGVPQREDLELELRVQIVGPLLQQPGEVADDLEHGLPPHFGGVGGDDRGDAQVGQQIGGGRGVDTGGDQAIGSGLDAARLRPAAACAVEPPAPLLMDVFGRVDQQREPAERPDQMELVGDRPTRERLGQPAEWAAAVAPVGHGALANVLDEGEHLVPRLFADHVAEQPPEQPDVGAEQLVLAGIAAGIVAATSVRPSGRGRRRHPPNVGAAAPERPPFTSRRSRYRRSRP